MIADASLDGTRDDSDCLLLVSTTVTTAVVHKAVWNNSHSTSVVLLFPPGSGHSDELHSYAML